MALNGDMWSRSSVTQRTRRGHVYSAKHTRGAELKTRGEQDEAESNQDWATRERTEHGETEWDGIGHGRTEDETRPDRTGRDGAGCGLDGPEQVSPGHNRSEQNRALFPQSIVKPISTSLYRVFAKTVVTTDIKTTDRFMSTCKRSGASYKVRTPVGLTVNYVFHLKAVFPIDLSASDSLCE